MKNKQVTVLVCAIVAAAALVLPAMCPAQDNQDDQKAFWAEPERSARWAEPTDEMIDRVMNRLRQDEPEKAEQLEQLRRQDPKKFKTEIREVMREHFRRRRREGAEAAEPGERPRFPKRPTPRRPGEPGKPRGRGRSRPMHQVRREFLEWLEKNYPDETQDLAKLREADPENYERRFGLLLRKYRRLYEMAREDPNMAELLKKDFELKQERDQILRKLRRAKDDRASKDLTEQLQQVVNRRFDVIVKRKQMEYERLLEKLERLKQHVQKSEAEVAKWKEPDFKQHSVEARVEELLSPDKDFKWD